MQLTVLYLRRSRYAPLNKIIIIIEVFASPGVAAGFLAGPGLPGSRERPPGKLLDADL